MLARPGAAVTPHVEEANGATAGGQGNARSTIGKRAQERVGQSRGRTRLGALGGVEARDHVAVGVAHDGGGEGQRSLRGLQNPRQNRLEGCGGLELADRAMEKIQVLPRNPFLLRVPPTDATPGRPPPARRPPGLQTR